MQKCVGDRACMYCDQSTVQILKGWLMTDEECLRSDPYAGAFFSKDRSEEVIESMEISQFATIETMHNTTTLSVLSRSEWMSGCPEEGKLRVHERLSQLMLRGAKPFASAVFQDRGGLAVRAWLWSRLSTQSQRSVRPFRQS